MAPDPPCPFCTKLADPAGWPADEAVWNFRYSVAFLGRWQYYTGYCVLVARAHASELSQLGSSRSEFLNEMSILAAAIERCFQPHKLNYELLGNQVPHLHWHLFPRSVSDPDRRRPVWFAIESAEADPAATQRLESGIRSRAESIARLRGWLIANAPPEAPGRHDS
jgi:diadenosine tetraphosphate (Ap4A) HIT family hydrolase